MPELLHHGKRLHALTFNKPSKFKCIWGWGYWVTRIPSCYVRRQRKKELFLRWGDKRALWNVTGMPCELLGILSSQCEGLSVRNGKLPPGQREDWIPHLLKLVARIPFHSKKKESGRREREKMLSVAQTLQVSKSSTYLPFYFSAFLPFVFSFLSSHAKVQSNQEPFLEQESLVL